MTDWQGDTKPVPIRRCHRKLQLDPQPDPGFDGPPLLARTTGGDDGFARGGSNVPPSRGR